MTSYVFPSRDMVTVNGIVKKQMAWKKKKKEIVHRSVTGIFSKLIN